MTERSEVRAQHRMTHAYDPGALSTALHAWRERPIEPFETGFTGTGATTAAELVDRKVRLRGGELTFPLMVIRESALSSNIATLAAWCADQRVELAPHGKTTMSPELIARQLEAGAWGVTAATIGQVRAYVDFGVRRVVLANQLVDPAGIGWLARATTEDPDLTVIGYVDSREGVALLDRELTRHGATRRLPVLVELGLTGRRTGARSMEAAMAVAQAVANTSTLAVAGATGYEGVVGHGRTPEQLDAVAAFCRDIRALGLRLRDEGLVDPAQELLLSAGGSTYFDVVARELVGDPATAVLRSGGYVTHDEGLYGPSTPLPTGGSPYELRAALEVWAYVLSRPEAGRALVGAGRRDLPFDVELPVVYRIVSPEGSERHAVGAVVSALNDQHAFIDLPRDAEVAVGDLVAFGISHPCTAFDKWRVIPVLDDDDRIVEIAHTLF
ncbi:amino acid deaminase [Actinopolymorpha sp. B17G11]|uniref:amino acid deaminase n=1 Tax=Actinopolymorpha sp. B17G11 TaxID=3160861 RepID=UPI0032E4409A